MRIVKPSYKIEYCPNYQDLLRKFEFLARNCYKSEGLISDGTTECRSCGGFGDFSIAGDPHICKDCNGEGRVQTDDPSSIKFLRKRILRTADLQEVRTCLIANGLGKYVPSLSFHDAHEGVLEHDLVTVRFICDRGCCYSEDTEVLTEEGWKLWPDVRGDEYFATLRTDGHVEYQRATAHVVQEYDGELYWLHTSMIDLLVTPNHNMYVQKHDTQAAKRGEEPWQLVPVEEIYGKRVKYKRNACMRQEGVRYVTIPDFVTVQGNRWGEEQPHTRKGREVSANLFARFLGYWLAEGSLEHGVNSSYQVHLFQNVGPRLQEIVSILTDMGYNPAIEDNGGSTINKVVTVCDAALYAWLKPYHGAANKRIPREILRTLSGRDLLALILRFIEGDGSRHCRGGHMQGYTISKGMADDLQEAALYAGVSATTWIDDRVGKTGGRPNIVHRHPCYVVSIVTEKNEPLVNHGGKTVKGKPHERWLTYQGKVYCVTVPNHTLYIRRNGRPCWSGNSHELVRHRLSSYLQESTRYCLYVACDDGTVEVYGKGPTSDHMTAPKKRVHDMTFIKPCFWGEGSEEYTAWLSAMVHADHWYKRLHEMGATAEKARSVLPNSLKTEVIETANIRQWRSILKLRTAKAAHPQMRELMVPLLQELKRRLPVLFEDIWDANANVG